MPLDELIAGIIRFLKLQKNVIVDKDDKDEQRLQTLKHTPNYGRREYSDQDYEKEILQFRHLFDQWAGMADTAPLELYMERIQIVNARLPLLNFDVQKRQFEKFTPDVRKDMVRSRNG